MGATPSIGRSSSDRCSTDAVGLTPTPQLGLGNAVFVSASSPYRHQGRFAIVSNTKRHRGGAGGGPSTMSRLSPARRTSRSSVRPTPDLG